MSYHPLTEAEVLAVLAEGELDASDLLYTANPNFEKQFKNLTKGLEKLMKEVRKYFPDAEYYSANDGICLLLGRSHGDSGEPQQELEAADGGLVGMLSGGDW
ncbi:MAG: hypothetical protein AAGE79_08450 [Acinetobacter pittii]